MDFRITQEEAQYSALSGQASPAKEFPGVLMREQQAPRGRSISE
jgi:hypothetical protein